jgi:hypothetical protein
MALATTQKPSISKAQTQIQSLPANWPKEITYLTSVTFSEAVTDEQKAALGRTTDETSTWPKIPASEIIAPSPLVEIKLIFDEKHPAHGQRGLFATKNLEPDTFLLLYIGHVHTNSLSDTDPHSDYDLSFDRHLSLSVDASSSGNESRCANDYRGIAERPNAEFRDCFVQVPCEKRKGGLKWERRVGIFVLSAGKAGKRRKGIRAGEEVVVSYGKGFWEGRKTVAEFRGDGEMLRIAKLALEE